MTKTTTPELLFANHLQAARFSDGGGKYAQKDGTLHEWTGGFWRPLPAEELEKEAWSWLCTEVPHQATPRTAASCAVAAVLAAEQIVGKKSGAEVLIPARNGTVEVWRVDAGDYEIRIRPAERMDGLTYCLACDFDAGVASPRFDRFMQEVLPDEDVREYVREYVGYTLLPDTRFQRALFLLGGGANGKSTLAEVVAALHEKTASMTLDGLEGFKLAGLLGASLVYVDETPARIDEQRLKSIISGGLIQVDRKYRDPLSLRPTAKWLILGNSLPAISDQSLGFWRRLPVIPFSQTFPDGHADPLLSRHIQTSELSGVLNWALAGLVRLLARGRFGVPPSAVVDAVAGGKRETNSVLAWWLARDGEVAEGVAVAKDEVYSDYRRWCLDNGMGAVSSPKFWKRLADVAGAVSETRKREAGDRRRYVNIQLPAANALPI